jgi:hypothetical protein
MDPHSIVRRSPSWLDLRRAAAAALGASLAVSSSACMSLTPQLAPTDYAALEQIEDRGEREQAYADHTIYRHDLPQGTRYTKGTDGAAQQRSWQSLDAVLRSDANSAAVLPRREQRLARLFTALTIAAGIVTIAGAAASAREGLDLGSLNGTGALLLGGGLATVGFGVTGGVFYGKMRKGYEDAVDVYNDSLGMRLGILTAKGEYIPPRGALVDERGFVLLEEKERTIDAPTPQPEAEVEPPTPDPAAAPPERAPSETVAPAPERPEAAKPQPEASGDDPPLVAEPPGTASIERPGRVLSLHTR